MHVFHRSVLVLSTLFTIVTGPLDANAANGKVLFDFEAPKDLDAWQLNMPQQDKLCLSRNFATHGSSAIVWRTPKWSPGMQQWPIWQTTPPIKDWTLYDRIAIDFTNPTDSATLIRLKAVDADTAKTPSGEWPGASVSIPPRSSRREILKLDSWMGNAINRSNITVFLFYTARAQGDFEIYIDNVTLLPPDAQPTPLPRQYINEVASMQVSKSKLPAAEAALERSHAALQKSPIAAPSVQAWLQKMQETLSDSVQQARNGLKRDDLSIELIAQLADQMTATRNQADRLTSLIALAREMPPETLKRDYLLGIAGSTEKILPRDMPLNLSGKPEVSLALARNEREGFQITVIPTHEAMKGVRVEVSDLVDDQGNKFAAKNIDTRVVGYVKTQPPEYDVSYVGWWPDPLLDFLPTVDVEPGDAQSFWVRLKAPKSQKPGTYRGTVTLISENYEPSTVAVTVQIRNFTMPDRSPLPLALTTGDEAFFKKYSRQDWQTLKIKYADFLSEYFITTDSLYRHGPPDMEVILHHRDNGTLGFFNLGTLDHTTFTPKMTETQFQAQLQNLLSELRPGYQAAKEAGVLDRAYIYGFDEVTSDYIPLMKRVLTTLKQEFPDVKLITTALGADWGPQSGLPEWDVWCPVLTDYKPDRAEQVRKDGREVWWYTCQSPAHPYPNVFTEYPAIEMRLLPGVMTFKSGAQGFLYYCLMRDQGPPRETINTGPFTAWDACCFSQPFNGEGYWMYPGVDGNPLSSIRLENFRDGIEDYAYLQILTATADAVEALPAAQRTPAQAKWLREARTLLEVPASLVKSPYEFSTDAKVLTDYRAKLADAIESAGIAPVTPWEAPAAATSNAQ